MKRRNRSILLLLAFLLSACSPGTPKGSPTGAASATLPGPTQAQGTPKSSETLPTVSPKVTHVPAPQTALETFLSDWQKGDYQAMYTALDAASRTTITQDAFTALYTAFAQNLTLQGLDFTVYAGQYDPHQAKLSFKVTYHTALFKDLERQNEGLLVMEQGAWKLKWDDGLPMPELRGGNKLALDLTVPQRGQIQDRNGEMLAGEANAVALGFIPGNLNPDQQDTVFDTLALLTGRVPQDLRDRFDNTGPNEYIPAGEVAVDDLANQGELLSSLEGVQQWPFGPSRFYPWSGVAPHVIGYVQAIPKETLDEYLRKGYRRDEKVGMSGLEAWSQDVLSGTRGANLYLLNSKGESINRLAQVGEEPGQTVVTTLDMRLQRQAQDAIRDYRGAIVVLERDTGRVLAMVSSPGYDPNLFNPENFNGMSGGGLTRLLNSDGTPLINRATGDQASGYPLGSVFKIIDLAAALESGLFTPESTYDCQYTFTEIVGRTYYDWTKEKEKPPSGLLTLPQGLMRSCNPWFYHIGLTLFREGHEKDIANMARGFGLGSPTGLDALPENAGNVPEPDNEVQAVEQAIGQDKLQVTPLQVADFIAAVGNGGTLYKPKLIEKTVRADGTETQVFKPEERGKLPIKPETLAVIQQAMRSVVNNKRGTAINVFNGFGIPVYGKTGTASLDEAKPFAWFAAYTDNGNPNRPDIAVVVVCENTGEGSEVAAPIARRVIESYFFGKPLKLYPWEEHINVRRTETPTPEPGQETPTETPQP